MPARWRNSDVFAEIAFTGLVLPGVVLVSEWGPDGNRLWRRFK
jgi:hypothetical protein